MDYFVLDRDSGHPLKSVDVKSFVQRYEAGKSVYQPFKTYQTDQHGYFRLSSCEGIFKPGKTRIQDRERLSV